MSRDGRTTSWDDLGHEVSTAAIDGLTEAQTTEIVSGLSGADIVAALALVSDSNMDHLDPFSPKDSLRSNYYREKSYLFDLAALLESGREVETTMFGIPVKISPINKKEE